MSENKKYDKLMEGIDIARKGMQSKDANVILYFDDDSRDAFYHMKGDIHNIKLAICRAMDDDESIRKIFLASLASWLREHQNEKEMFIDMLKTAGFAPGVN